MAKALGVCACGLLVALAPIGCSKNPFAFMSKADQPLVGQAAATAAPWGGASNPAAASTAAPSSGSSWTTALTENRVSKAVGSAFNRGVEMVTPKPKVVPAVDPISLANQPQKPSADLYVSMAQIQERAGGFSEASGMYEKALELDPKHRGALIGLARLYDRQDRLADAMGMYQRAAQLYPKDSSVLNDLALCYARQNQLERSRQALEQAIALVPDKPLYRNNIAVVCVEMDRIDEALAHLQHAHGPAVAHYNLGFLLQQRGRRREAAAHFSSALAADPSLTQARDWLAALQGAAPTTGHPAQSPRGEQDAPTARTASAAAWNQPMRLPAFTGDSSVETAPAAASSAPEEEPAYPKSATPGPLPKVEVYLNSGVTTRL